MSQDVDGVDCADIYTTKIGFNSDQANALCGATDGNFTFSDPFASSVALTTVFLYTDVFNQWYYDEFASLMSLATVADAETLFYGDNGDTQIYAYMFQLQADLKTFYEPLNVCGGTTATTD